jgi:hypothetical protein
MVFCAHFVEEALVEFFASGPKLMDDFDGEKGVARDIARLVDGADTACAKHSLKPVAIREYAPDKAGRNRIWNCHEMFGRACGSLTIMPHP